jgi:drug/metabolite transporter (DMT)-like permease
MKTIFMIFVVSLCTLSSQLLLKKGMTAIGAGASFTQIILAPITSLPVATGVLLQGCGFILWLAVLTKANLGYAFGFSGAFFYILLPLLSWWLYNEQLTALQWCGMGFISLGVVCIVLKNL